MVVGCDLRTRFGDIRDQGARPTCLAFSVSDTHAALRPYWQPLSCEYAYFYAVDASHKDPDRGVDFDSILKILRTKGQPPEGEWPYLKNIPCDRSAWKPPVGVAPLYRRESMKRTNDLDCLLNSIEKDAPVVIGMTISKSFYQPGALGIVSTNEPLDPARRHAVIGLGCGTHASERLVLVRNNWGDRWGQNGYAWLSESYLRPRLIAYAELTEDLTV